MEETLIDAVIEQLKKDFEQHDYTSLEEILGCVPDEILIASLPDEEQSKFQ